MSVPSALTVESTTTSTADLRWTNSLVDGTTYNIKRVLAGGTPITIATTAANATSYTDTTPVSGVDYDYQVCAASTANCTSVVGVVIQVCGLLQNEVAGFNLPRVGTAVAIGGGATQEQQIAQEVIPLFDQAMQKLETQLNEQVLNTNPCVICPENSSVVLNCRDCQDFQVNVTENINSISMVDCTSGEGNIEFVVPPGVTRNICGFPATFGFEGGECSITAPAGTSLSAPYSGTSRGPQSRGGFMGTDLTQQGTGGGGGGGGGSCSCSSLDGLLKMVACNSTKLCSASTKSKEYRACGGIPPYTWSTTNGSVSPATGKSTTLSAPANSGSGTAGNAYNERLVGTVSDGLGGCNEHIQIEVHGCNDQVTVACAGGGIDSPCPFDPLDECGQHICVGTPNTYGQTGSCPSTSAPCVGTLDFTTGLTCDIRTAPMVAAGCNPCRVSMKGAVITVTDSIGTAVSTVLEN